MEIQTEVFSRIAGGCDIESQQLCAFVEREIFGPRVVHAQRLRDLDLDVNAKNGLDATNG